MQRRAGLLLAVVAVLVAVPACARRNCVPDSVANTRHLIDLCAEPDAHAPVPPGLLREVEAEFRRRGAGVHPPGARPYHFLALSGGGMYGSFGVGVMAGWTEAGTRPRFDVVTGISAGALIATYAFLGPEYDPQMKATLVGVELDDIARRRSILALAYAESFYDTRRLAARIDQAVTPELLAEVAAAHAAGRRLYIGTTNIDTRRLIIWDMGAIASRGTPESVRLYRSVILASAAVPGAFAPVRIPVEIDGRCYEELHVDGGASDEVIFRAFMVADLNRAAGVPGAHAPPGSTLYVVNNGKMYAEPSCVRPRVFKMVGTAFGALVYGKTRDELYRIYLNCLETGVQFRTTAIPQALPMGERGSLQQTAEDQERLFEVGRGVGVQTPGGEYWRDLPPGTNPAEQALPRSGTKFATPGGAAGCAPAVGVAPVAPRRDYAMTSFTTRP